MTAVRFLVVLAPFLAASSLLVRLVLNPTPRRGRR